MSPEEQSQFNRMSPAEKKSFLQSRGTASGGVASGTIQDSIKAGMNTVRMLDELSKDPRIDKYGYTVDRMKNKGLNFMSGLTRGLIKENPEYQDYRALTDVLRLMVFDFGGKQLTETEKSFVMAAVPSGDESTPSELRAKIRRTQERIKYLTTAQSRLANLPRAEYERAVSQELGKYKEVSSMPSAPQGQPSGAGPSAPQVTIPKLAPEGLNVVRGAPKGKTFTIGGQTYTREQLLGEK
jgi:hypothetical protein